MKITTILAVILGGSFTLSAAEQKTDCQPVSESLEKAVKGKTVDEMLKLLEKEVETTPDCSCELIKSAIKGYKPTSQVVARMVETAIIVASDYMKVIFECAIAEAPDAREAILAVADKYKVTISNPLDFPGLLGQDPVGQYLFNSITPVFVNPPGPPVVTTVNPD